MKQIIYMVLGCDQVERILKFSTSAVPADDD